MEGRLEGTAVYASPKDNPAHGQRYSVISNTWRSAGNAQVHRQRHHSFYLDLLGPAAALGQLHYAEIPVEPESEPVARKVLTALMSRLRRSGGHARRWTCLRDGRAYLAILMDRPHAELSAVPVAAEDLDAVLYHLLSHAGPLPAAYERLDVVGGSRAWALPKLNNGKNVVLGTAPADFATGRGSQDEVEVARALVEGLATRLESEEQLNARSPDSVVMCRHYDAPDELTLLRFVRSVGARLTPRAFARLQELEAEARADARIGGRR